MIDFHLWFCFRSGSSNSINKFDGASLPASSNGRAIPKNELEKVSLPRDSMSGLSKERLKGNSRYVLLVNLVVWYLACNEAC